MINAAIIGSGIGLKHLEAIQGYRNSKVKIICEKNSKKIKKLKLKFKNIKIISNENEIFYNKEINLVSIASYDDDHFYQIKKCIENEEVNANIIDNNKERDFNHYLHEELMEKLNSKKILKFSF